MKELFDKYICTYNLYSGEFKTHMLSMIRNDEPFKSAYKSFLRDCKIDSILN